MTIIEKRHSADEVLGAGLWIAECVRLITKDFSATERAMAMAIAIGDMPEVAETAIGNEKGLKEEYNRLNDELNGKSPTNN